MKVALVVPEPSPKQKHGLKLNDNCAPFNLGYLASYLRLKRPDVQIRIIDGLIGMNVWNELYQFEPDIIGVTATTAQAPSAYTLGEMLKRKRTNPFEIIKPNILTVIGGVHASAMPQEALEYFDMVVVGEGEQTLVDIVNGYYKRGIIQGETLPNLDDVPMPAYDLMHIEQYLKHELTFPGLEPPVFDMVTSRGCPFNCAFCDTAHRKNPRWFSASRVIAEIEYILEHYNVGSFFFWDDEFFVNRKRLTEISKLLKERQIKITWGACARANSITLETLEVAKKMGCKAIFCGYESAVPRILKYLKSGTTTIAANEHASRLAEKAGITMGGNIIFGTPTETLEEMRQTLKWYEKQSSIKYVGFTSLIPFPGTDVYALCLKKGLLPNPVDYERFVTTNRIKEAILIDKAVNIDNYNRFLIQAIRTAWILSLLRCGRKFRSLFTDPHLWYMLIYHPVKVFRMLNCSLKHEPITC